MQMNLETFILIASELQYNYTFVHINFQTNINLYLLPVSNLSYDYLHVIYSASNVDDVGKVLLDQVPVRQRTLLLVYDRLIGKQIDWQNNQFNLDNRPISFLLIKKA